MTNKVRVPLTRTISSHKVAGVIKLFPSCSKVSREVFLALGSIVSREN